jgi:hypothetical protein
MNELEVERLAAMENARWSRGSGDNRSDGAPADQIRGDRTPSLDPQWHQRLWKATAPLRGPEVDRSTSRDRLADFRFLGATAVGSVLVVRFTWLPDDEQREYLLHLDFGRDSELNLDGASVELFEYILFNIVDDPEWYLRSAIPISPRVSLYVPQQLDD